MPARLRGRVSVTAATRFETRYVTRANLATRYAPRAAQFNARVESTSATDTSHFASSLAPTTRGEGKERRQREDGRPYPAILVSAFAPSPAGALTRARCLHLRCAYAVPSTRNCARNLRARRTRIYDRRESVAATLVGHASSSKGREEGHKGNTDARKKNEGGGRGGREIRAKMWRNTKGYERWAGSESVM